MSTRNSSGLCVIKSKLTPRIGYVVGAVKFFFFFFLIMVIINIQSLQPHQSLNTQKKKKKKIKHDTFYLHC